MIFTDGISHLCHFGDGASVMKKINHIIFYMLTIGSPLKNTETDKVFVATHLINAFWDRGNLSEEITI